MKRSGILILLLFCAGFIQAQDLSKFEKKTFTSAGGTLNYRILYPENFDATKKYPVVFFLHGSGERGNDNEKQLAHGSKMFLDPDFRKKFPAVVIFPQCDESSYWSNVKIDEVPPKHFFTFVKGGEPTAAMSLLLGLTEEMIHQPFADQSRIYVGGLSMGGMGTFELLRRKPKVFAAAFAICGGDNVANVKKYQNVPLWIFHGGLDDIVSPQFSFWIYNELKTLGKSPKFTIYPNANHNSWDSAFAEPELMPWLFGNTK